MFLDELRHELAELDAHSLRRSLRYSSTPAGRTIVIDNKNLLNFSSNNYLGLAHHPQVIAAVQSALATMATSAASSRLISGSAAIHLELEQALAEHTGHESALVFPSGYMANLAAVTALVGPSDAVVMDRLAHASLIDAARLSGARIFVYPHAGLEGAEKALRRTRGYRRRLLLTESLFSMDGDVAPLDALHDLCVEYEAISLCDEAHAFGVLGESGRGVLEGKKPWTLVVGTLSKALGSQGGFVSSSRVVIDTLINRARSFIFTTGLAPLNAIAALAALRLSQTDASRRANVASVSQRLRNHASKAGWNLKGSQSHIVPVVVGSAENALRLGLHLEKLGIYAPAIRPPTVPSGECRIRFSITAEHNDEDISRVEDALARWKETI